MFHVWNRVPTPDHAIRIRNDARLHRPGNPQIPVPNTKSLIDVKFRFAGRCGDPSSPSRNPCEQEARRHEFQVRQLQAGLRQANQTAIGTQNETTQPNKENARLVVEAGTATKQRSEQQAQGAQLQTAMNRALADQAPGYIAEEVVFDERELTTEISPRGMQSVSRFKTPIHRGTRAFPARSSTTCAPGSRKRKRDIRTEACCDLTGRRCTARSCIPTQQETMVIAGSGASGQRARWHWPRQRYRTHGIRTHAMPRLQPLWRRVAQRHGWDESHVTLHPRP